MNQRRHFLRSLSGAAVATLVTGAGAALPAWAQSTTGSTTKGSGSGSSTAGSSGSSGSAGSSGGAALGTSGSTAGGSGSTSGGASGGAGAAGGAAGSTPKLEESDTQAVALGYKHDTTKVDQKKFPNHQATQVCSGCQFFQGTASNGWAPCTIFAGKQVAAKGWCSSYVKKAAG
jgi:hypothetical protein